MRFPSPPLPAPNRTRRPWARPLRRLRPLSQVTAETALPENPSMQGNPWPLLSAPNAKTFHSSPRKPSSTRRLLCLSSVPYHEYMRKRTPGKPDKPQLEPACSRSPSDPANARLIHRGKPPAPRYSSPPCTYSRRRAFALSTIKRNFQKRKNALQISRFPPSAARKTKKTPPSVRFCEKTADPREQKHGHPPSWCAKKIPS